MRLTELLLAASCGPFLAASVAGCEHEGAGLSAVRPGAPSARLEAARAPHDPIRIEVLDPEEQPPTFVLRGRPRGPGLLVFLHGMCGHGLGYAQSFQHSAAKRGLLIAPQADVPCGKGPWAKWSQDVAALDARIVSAFQRLGHAGPVTDVTVLGYSQGATRAEALARKFPERYARLVLMGGPGAPSPQGLSSLRAAVMMAGELDRRDLMQQGARAYAAAKIPATFLIIPGARHGAMGPTPEATMGEALDWLFANSRDAPR